MPSDLRIQQALDALAEPIRDFRSTLANTSEQIRLLISTRVDHSSSTTEVARAELGDFAAGRIDPERMARLFSRVEPPTIQHADVVHRALDVCRELLARRENLFRIDVPEGGDLHAAVGRGLAEIGRAFAVTRIVDLIAQGEYRDADHALLLEGHPFERWSRAERKVDLPLVVCVSGSDLRASGLADFLDRSVAIVVVVQGESPPAPLTRLISPGVLVVQTADPRELEWIEQRDGPRVLALMPPTAAQFRHDPEAGPDLADRIVITQLPEEPPRRLGVSSGFQQREDLAQLEALAAISDSASRSGSASGNGSASRGGPPATERAAEPDFVAPVAAVERAQPEAGDPTDAVDRLSAWLLEHADSSGPG